MLIRFFTHNSVRSEILVTADLSAEKNKLKYSFGVSFCLKTMSKLILGKVADIHLK
jgi:hypothetical protein